MQFSIKHISLFKEKINMITNVVNEAAVKFRKNEIEIYAISPDNVIIIELLIPKKNLVRYKYKNTKSICLNLSCLRTVLSRFKNIKGNLKIKIQCNKFEISARDDGVKKTFCLSIIPLDNEPKIPKWKPNVKWKVKGMIDGFSEIWMFVNKGPLVIESIKDDFPLRWFIAPIRVSKNRRIKR